VAPGLGRRQVVIMMLCPTEAVQLVTVVNLGHIVAINTAVNDPQRHGPEWRGQLLAVVGTSDPELNLR
tara:strand:- start:1114 stop:1317 length:204 start_codon:yes stop_codon:yes gene_type:complete